MNVLNRADANQPANILRKQKYHDKTRHIGRPLLHCLCDAGKHRGRQKQRTAESDQFLAHIDIVRACRFVADCPEKRRQ